MNKFGIVLGAAAVVTLAGCKDPDYQRADAVPSQVEVKDAAPAQQSAAIAVVEQPVAKKCACPPGTVHTAPCTCGDLDCRCIVQTKPIAITATVSKPAAPVTAPVTQPEYSVYVVQSGDYLAKISKKFNVTIASIKRLNPSIKKDVVRVGQKLKIPGRHDVSAVDAAPKAAKAPVKKSGKKAVFAAYAGATKEYVVKAGDTLGSIAYGNGINIRQLKDLNGMTSDTLRVGQKLKIPAEKVVTAKKAADGKKPEVKKPDEKKTEAAEAEKKPQEPQPKAEESAQEPQAQEPQPAAKASEANAAEADPAAPEPQAAVTYLVKEGDDITGVAIHWGISSAAIRELNNLGENDQLVPGQVIKLPPEAQQ